MRLLLLLLHVDGPAVDRGMALGLGQALELGMDRGQARWRRWLLGGVVGWRHGVARSSEVDIWGRRYHLQTVEVREGGILPAHRRRHRACSFSAATAVNGGSLERVRLDRRVAVARLVLVLWLLDELFAVALIVAVAAGSFPTLGFITGEVAVVREADVGNLRVFKQVELGRCRDRIFQIPRSGSSAIS